MALHQRIEWLISRGLYSDAFDAVTNVPILTERLAARKLFLSSHIGDLRTAQAQAEPLLRRHSEPYTAAVCKEVMGRSMLVHSDRSSEGLRLCSESKEIARAHLGPVEYARNSAEFVAILLQRVGIAEALEQMPQLRTLVLSTGDVQSLTMSHLIRAEIRFKQGQRGPAIRDLGTASDLLSREPHMVLDGRRALAAAAIETLDGTLSQALALAEHAVACSAMSGSVTLRIPALGTLAHVLLLKGDFTRCERTLEEATTLARPGSIALIALADTRMQRFLAMDAIQDAACQAARTFALSSKFDNGFSYYGLWHLITRSQWLLRTNRAKDSVRLIESAIPHAEHTADSNLLVRMKLSLAESLGASGRPMDGMSVLDQVLRDTPCPPLDAVGEMARLLGCLTTDDEACAGDHFERASRVFSAIGHCTAAADVTRSAGATRYSRQGRDAEPCIVGSATRALTSAAAMSMVAKNPGLLGAEAAHVLRSSSTEYAVSVVEEDEVGARRVIAGSQRVGVTQEPTFSAGQTGTRIVLGAKDRRRYELAVDSSPSPASRTALQSIERLIHIARVVAHVEADDPGARAPRQQIGATEQLGVVFSSQAMASLVHIARQVAPTNATVFITGETGTGKEVLARAVHMASDRHRNSFMPFNCATVPRDMLDAQLFGYRRGAFTGATQDYPGVIRAASGGTLFLDEVAEMPLDVQPKLLRFLESGEILPLGETRLLAVNVRVIAATNAEVERLVASGRFREDLFYRLHVVRMRVPPLRERREEIPLLVRTLSERLAREAQREALQFSEEALEYLTVYDWPGNTRQLANELRRVMALTAPGILVQRDHLSPEIAGAEMRRPAVCLSQAHVQLRLDQPLSAAVEQLERTLIAEAIKKSNGSMGRAAASLGLSRKGLFLKRRRFGIC